MRYAKYKQTGIPWLPEAPAEWTIRRFKYVITSLRKGNGVTKEDVFENGDLPCVRYGEIYTKYDHSFEQCISKTKKELMVKPQYFRKGDILFSCTGEFVEEIGKNIVYCGEGSCVAGGDIIVVSHLQNPEYLNYYLNSYPTQLQKSYGKAKLKVVHIHASDIQNLLTLLPSLPEQRAIVAYLDDKCGKIDELVAAKEKEVELLKELKQTVIADAVTGKWKMENEKCRMRPSGIPRLPQIPEGWEVKRLGAYFTNLFKAMDFMKLFHGMGTGIRLTLSFSELKKQMLPIPSLEEQRAIVDYIEEKTAKIDQAVAGLTQQVAALKEYKQRLIADVVTGQMRVADE